jgi:hypothetical protein
MKRRRFGQNAPFHLKGKGGKMWQSSHWSSICDLFNRVLKCNFYRKNQFNCIPAKNLTAPLELAAFFTLILGLELVQLDPQLSNKLLMSSIKPLIRF